MISPSKINVVAKKKGINYEENRFFARGAGADQEQVGR